MKVRLGHQPDQVVDITPEEAEDLRRLGAAVMEEAEDSSPQPSEDSGATSKKGK